VQQRFLLRTASFWAQVSDLRKPTKEAAMMMRTDFQATGHRSQDMQELSAGAEAIPVHPRLSKQVARHDVTTTLLGAGCAAAICGLLALLFSLG
jgi:hypothetical protein